MIKVGDTLEGIVLEVKKSSVIIKFGNRAIEAKALTDLKEGEEIKVRIKGWYNGELLLKVLSKRGDLTSGSIDIKV